ncbi:type III restriction-modification system endonuclease [Leuconostoc gelidum]|uniref:DEAD/DEAH box helicase family protein n=1 Tax=Leuconostoc gelidum subsp. gelidum TaxID=1607839 RepID=A0AB35FZE0_LEUGE|nr:DEAD/DEAH box helicase family protein [Leuconostoc gelidum]MBZ6016017.1 DEAD/DEAH box helicase family protein [Leuconostoc gelidum subsp. gelidum]
MKLQYKNQQFQLDAVNAVTAVFEGQPKQSGLSYMMDMGANPNIRLDVANTGFKNEDIALSDDELLRNIKAIQKENGILSDNKLVKMAIGGKDKATKRDNSRESLTLTVEMETGTGKTYTYIKTMFELHKQYGWSKFIIVVPSIAIREGVAKTFESTAEHFKAEYGLAIRPFVYNSSQLDKIEAFASDAGINVMIVNTQAFNARGADARRIDMVLDQFRGRRPIDVIAATNPIMIIDEPQSVLGDGTKTNATRVGLAKFNPLLFVNYSATHRDNYNMVYRLDAVDAYQKQLVKKISVKGIELSGSNASSGYLYVESIAEKPNLKVRVQFEKISATGKVVKTSKLLDKGDNIYQLSGEVESYKAGFVVSEINAVNQFVEFTNGIKLHVGVVVGNANDDDLRRIQIRETINSHLSKEASLFKRGIKTLSLFFIDEVVKYKDYDAVDDKGAYALMFEEEYENIVRDRLTDTLLDSAYRAYLEREINTPEKVHAGYFSVDKKGKSIDSKVKRGNEASDDISAYDLIMKNKERLLSFDEPVRFIFSHSALKEGWDNPNVFQIATLRQSSSDIKKRQEIGRGLRLSVNQNGDRQDAQSLGEGEVQQVNVLTVIANESYENFARDLQSELAEAVKNRPKFVEPKLFEGRELVAKDASDQTVSSMTVDNAQAAEIWASLKANGIITKEKQTSDSYKEMSVDEQIAAIKASLDDDYQAYVLPIQELVNSVYDPQSVPIEPENKRVTLKLNDEKYASQSFKNLWSKINRKSYYTVNFEDDEIIEKSIKQINKELTVATLKARVTQGNMNANDSGTVFTMNEQHTEYIDTPSNHVKYDLIGEISQNVGLLRKTVGKILAGIDESQFSKYKSNPESFIAQVSNIINGVKAQNIVSHIIYNKLDEVWDEDAIFADGDIQGIIGENVFDAKKHLYDRVRVDSKTEKRFASELDIQNDVEMYVKLPGGFYINTPVGKYNPDWAVVLNEPNQKHVYFIAETKGVSDSIQLTLKGVENAKIESAREHFKVISNKEVKYDVVDSYEKMMGKLADF